MLILLPSNGFRPHNKQVSILYVKLICHFPYAFICLGGTPKAAMKGNLRSSPGGFDSDIITKLHDCDIIETVPETFSDAMGTAPETSDMGSKQLARSAFPVDVR